MTTPPFHPYQPYPPQPYPLYPPITRVDRNGMGTAGMVLAIISLCFAVIPVIGMIAWAMWPLAAIFSGVGLGLAKRGEATNHSSALAGIIVSATAALVCVGWVVFTVTATANGAAHQHG